MRTLRRVATTLVAAATLTAAALAAAPVATAGNAYGRTVLRGELVGSLPTDPAVAGVGPGAAPWVIDDGDVRLRADRLDVRVRGLVIPTTGVNPVPEVAASVVCDGTVVATTASVPFSTEGDARISAAVTLPDRCLAPVVLLNPRGNPALYIATTGAVA